jgi:hypothetical protein
MRVQMSSVGEPPRDDAGNVPAGIESGVGQNAHKSLVRPAIDQGETALSDLGAKSGRLGSRRPAPKLEQQKTATCATPYA